MSKKAIIIGAGPAGLTAAWELLHRTDIIPVILDKSGATGGLSQTINYKGNRIDIGGHRFFSKSDRVMKWWLNILPVDTPDTDEIVLQYQNREHRFQPSLKPAATAVDNGMLVRQRVSHIYYLKKFFSYPVTLSLDTLRKLGFGKITRILISYTNSRLFPIKNEKTLEDFFINRFGNNLYRVFFKDYTEKVWGVPCSQIPAEWGAQRIKELSVTKALIHAVKAKFKTSRQDISQKNTTTTLIQRFLYPKYGPGQLWEEVARIILSKGGEIHYHYDVDQLAWDNNIIQFLSATNSQTGEQKQFTGDYFFSTMPVKELIAGMGTKVPVPVQRIAAALQYRDFITVGLLVKKLLKTRADKQPLDDNWIYIQDRKVKLGRLQIFNNWSPSMASDPSTTWLGLEYFCNRTDEFWNLPDDILISNAVDELAMIELIDKADVLDHTVIRMENTYPAYFGAYKDFGTVRSFTDQFENLFLVGRNGMHKYNNADHSMLTAMTAVDNIINGTTTKQNIWEINTEQDYQE